MKELKLMDKLKSVFDRLLRAYTMGKGTEDVDLVWECYHSEMGVEKNVVGTSVMKHLENLFYKSWSCICILFF